MLFDIGHTYIRVVIQAENLNIGQQLIEGFCKASAGDVVGAVPQ